MKYNNNWYKNLKKSPLTPPSKTFSIVWPILYIMIFTAGLLVWKDKKCYPFCYAIFYFLIQLIFNLTWTTVFFKLQKPMASLLSIFIIMIFTILSAVKFYKINKLAFYLLIPYIIWLSFASYLNLYIVIYN